MAELDPQQPDSKRKKNLAAKWGLIGFCVVCAVSFGVYWWLTRNEVSTDDAFTAGRVITIAPHVNGYVSDLLVDDNQFVHKGQILLRIDPRDYVAARDRALASVEQAEGQLAASRDEYLVAQKNFPGRLDAARADILAAKAQIFKAQTDYNRQHQMARAATTQQEVDYSTAALKAAQAQLAQALANKLIAEPVEASIRKAKSTVTQQQGFLDAARAELAQADLNLGWTVIRAPHDGWVSKRNVEKGNYVTAGQSLLAIVQPEVWVVANYKETQITHIRPGQRVKIRVDAYPFLDLEGHVDSIQLGTGSTFSAFPPENATGNYVKIVQRVPVKILIDKGLDPKLPLSLGLSVIPTVMVH